MGGKREVEKNANPGRKTSRPGKLPILAPTKSVSTAETTRMGGVMCDGENGELDALEPQVF
jgi:hypothetical protein